ncbi:phosphoribosyltransferase [Paremcibacter congregatus]|uniref:Phosphoribosyl transferase n=1 Tax=Paremcibacter congregatus TaxID=2043170 RepID=A0A2G4YTY1_9PROT|nr:phosphoribosyltransferase [Paremcibacter congregatus]PHZ85788.1 phosphoribosyl transferase [Paremcibacter congregatus]QDE26750.1 phosphoribosyltransferase [Paremcibacter congregatus]
MYFRDRTHAGQELAAALSKYQKEKDTLVLALPRGGVPVAFEVAEQLKLPLDVLLVRKLGVPGQREFAMGAIAEDNILYINRDVVDLLDIPSPLIESVIKQETQELNRRRQLYRHDRPAPNFDDKTIILIDDGLATGATMHAAVNALKKTNASRLIIAIPVGSLRTCKELEELADELICLHTPEPFDGVGRWYGDFSQTSDEEVERLLMQNRIQKNSCMD